LVNRKKIVSFRKEIKILINMKNYLFQLFFITILAITFTNCTETQAEKETVVQQIQDTIPIPQPKLRPPYDSSKWTRILDIDETIIEDVRYATMNNFVEQIMYDCPACYLRPEAAAAVGEAHKMLKAKGYGGLKMFDCYRPRPIQQKLWDKVPDARYVTPPWKGSMHNRGLATDLTIVDSLGNQLDMGTKFDYFGIEGYHTYAKHSPEILVNRTLLKATMYAVGFRHIRTEWWHYSYMKASYPISDWLWDCEIEE
jgi:D-alanyl-D-alanine dipeptidase